MGLRLHTYKSKYNFGQIPISVYQILKWTGKIDDKRFWRRLSYLLPHQCHNINNIKDTEQNANEDNDLDQPMINDHLQDANEDMIQDIGYYPNLTITSAALKLYTMPHKTSGTYLVVKHRCKEDKAPISYHLIVLHEKFGKPYSYEISKVLVNGEMKLNVDKLDTRVHNNLRDLIEYYQIDSNSNLRLAQPYTPD